MKVKVLASGSKGNCTYVECGKTKILIDAGICFQSIKKELDTINVDVKDISIVLITHTHSDHIKGLSTLLNKTNISLYTSDSIFQELSNKINIQRFHIIDRFLNEGDIQIEMFPLSHDVECYFYMITYDLKTLVYITDTGYFNKKYLEIIKNKEIYIIESNHDEKMLMEGPYPFILKQRILSDKGHLSNSSTGRILSKVIGSRTKKIFLAHLSEHNNDKQLALNEVLSQIKEITFNKENIVVTDQYISSELVEV